MGGRGRFAREANPVLLQIPPLRGYKTAAIVTGMLPRKFAAFLVVASAIALLAGCRSGPPAAPVPEPTEVEPTVQLLDLGGEWVVTRTVTASDAPGPQYVVGLEEDRFVLFETPQCQGGECTGTLLSGLPSETRSETTYTQLDSEVSYQFTGLNDCVDEATGELTFADAYEYVLGYSLSVIAADEVDGTMTATRLEGTAVNTFSLLDAGKADVCTSGSGTVEYDVVAVRKP